MSKYFLMVFAGACSYGILSTLAKLSYREGFHAAEVSGVQALMGAVVLWVVVLMQKRSNTMLSNKTILELLITGAAIGLTTYLYYLSVEYISASVAVIILMQFTWMTILLDWLLLKNRPGIRLLVSIPVILIGTVLASGYQMSAMVSVRGLCFAFASAVCYALYIVANSRMAKGVGSITRSAVQVTGAFLGILMVNASESLEGIPLTTSFIKWTGLLALFGTIIPPLLFAKGIPKVGASWSSVLMVAEMPMAILCAAVVLHEPVSGVQYIGMAVMLGAIVYLTMNRR